MVITAKRIEETPTRLLVHELKALDAKMARYATQKEMILKEFDRRESESVKKES